MHIKGSYIHMTEEIWKPIDGFDGQYEVSTHGRVRSNYRSPQLHLKPGSNKGGGAGYLFVNLRRRLYYIHRLVLETFIGPAPEGFQALHAPDSNPGNNRLDNLRWGTRKENMADAAPGIPESQRKRALRMKEIGRVKLTEDLVTAIRLSPGGNDDAWAEKLGMPTYLIRSARNGNSWKHVKAAPALRVAGKGRRSRP